jgi:hypothetical protein
MRSGTLSATPVMTMPPLLPNYGPDVASPASHIDHILDGTNRWGGKCTEERWIGGRRCPDEIRISAEPPITPDFKRAQTTQVSKVSRLARRGKN